MKTGLISIFKNKSMESPKLILYASAEGCNLKEFKGELTLKELSKNTNSNKYLGAKYTEYSEALDEEITTKILWVEDLAMRRCIFSDGAELELMMAYNGRLVWMLNGFNELHVIEAVINHIRSGNSTAVMTDIL